MAAPVVMTMAADDPNTVECAAEDCELTAVSLGLYDRYMSDSARRDACRLYRRARELREEQGC